MRGKGKLFGVYSESRSRIVESYDAGRKCQEFYGSDNFKLALATASTGVR